MVSLFALFSACEGSAVLPVGNSFLLGEIGYRHALAQFFDGRVQSRRVLAGAGQLGTGFVGKGWIAPSSCLDFVEAGLWIFWVGSA